MKITRMADEVIQLASITAKVQGIIDRAHSEGMSGSQFDASLVYSGIALGADEAQRMMRGQMRQTAHTCEAMIRSLDHTIMMQTDESAVEALKATRSEVQGILVRSARMIRAVYVKNAEDNYGIDPKYLEEGFDYKTLPDVTVQLLGHVAYRNQPSVFICWGILHLEEELPKMKCVCSDCIFRRISKRVESGEQQLSEREVIDKLLEKHGSLDKVFKAFGLYVFETLHIHMKRWLEFEVAEHESTAEAATEFTNALIRGFSTNHERMVENLDDDTSVDTDYDDHISNNGGAGSTGSGTDNEPT